MKTLQNGNLSPAQGVSGARNDCGQRNGGAFGRLTTEIGDALRRNRGDAKGLLLRRYPEWLFTGDDKDLAGTVAVFAFHDVESGWFEQQLAFLKANGYNALPTADALYDCIAGGQPIPQHAVLLTFDDAGASLYTTAFPLLKQYGMHGVSFVVPTFLDRPRFCTWSQVQEMHRSGVIDFQSHTLCHRFAPKWPLPVKCLGTVTAGEDEARRHPTMLEDYRRARQLIEEHLGKPVRHLCYPDYDGTEESIAASKAAGYVSNFWGVLPRRTNRPGDDPFRIVRVSSEYLRSLPGKGRRSAWRIAAGAFKFYGGRKLLRLAGERAS